jgi:hypothetical protein
MLERGLSPEASQLLERLEPHFLRDVFNLAFAPSVASRRRKNARRISLYQRFEALGIALQNGGDQLRFGSFHWAEYARAQGEKSKIRLQIGRLLHFRTDPQEDPMFIETDFSQALAVFG